MLFCLLSLATGCGIQESLERSRCADEAVGTYRFSNVEGGNALANIVAAFVSGAIVLSDDDTFRMSVAGAVDRGSWECDTGTSLRLTTTERNGAPVSETRTFRVAGSELIHNVDNMNVVFVRGE